MEASDYFKNCQKPEQMVSLVRRAVFVTLKHLNGNNVMTKRSHLENLEKLIGHFRIYFCGNFYHNPLIKENHTDYRLEREFIRQHMFGYFIFNMDKFNKNISHNYVDIFQHIMNNYAYGTRRPLVDILENKGRILLRQLLHILATDADNSYCAAKLLCCCCQQKVLALKLIDLHDNDESGVNTSVPIYISLLQQFAVNKNKDYNHLINILKVLNALLLNDLEVANYALQRDVHILIETFNDIFNTVQNYFIRISGIELFVNLIQNRTLQILINKYTISIDNFKLIYSLTLKTQADNFDYEFVQLFEILRLFIMNPVNKDNKEFKEIFTNDYMTLHNTIERAQKIRSYADIVLFTPEYNDVIDCLAIITNNKRAKKIASDEFLFNNENDT